MTLQQTTPPPDQWDTFVKAQPRAHFLQLAGWGDLKAAYGWEVERVGLAAGGTLVAGAQLLFRRLPFRLGTMAYLAMGPYVAQHHDDPTSVYSQLWEMIDTCARQHNAAFLKWEPGIYRDGKSPPDFASLEFHKSAQTIQPPRTVLIDITIDEETILARINQGTRRKIRQSHKNNVRYYRSTRREIETFNKLMQVTGSRNEFGVHEPKYYEMMYDLFVPKGDGMVFLAEHDGDPLAGIFDFGVGGTAIYLSGASSNAKRNLMASYGIQWTAIQWAKSRGCHTYDMWGIPDADVDALETQFESRSDGLWGVYGFKRGWGGEVVRSLGAWDKVYNPLVYQAYRLAMKVRE